MSLTHYPNAITPHHKIIPGMPQEERDQQVADYLSKGGKIEVIPMGPRGDTIDDKIKQLRDNKAISTKQKASMMKKLVTQKNQFTIGNK